MKVKIWHAPQLLVVFMSFHKAYADQKQIFPPMATAGIPAIVLIDLMLINLSSVYQKEMELEIRVKLSVVEGVVVALYLKDTDVKTTPTVQQA